MRIMWKIITTLLLSLITNYSFAWATETSDKIWRSGWGQGSSEAEITLGSGNSIYISCGRYPVSISFSLVGSNPKPNSELMLIFEKQPVVMSVNNNGNFEANSGVEKSTVSYLLKEFKKKSHKSVYVRFSDGKEGTFTLNGAAKASACNDSDVYDKDK
jgi:hypothetical protein